MTVRILYFAYLRERAGRAGEDVTPPADVATVARLMDWLAAAGDGRERAFADRALIRVAVNREHVKMDHPIKAGDEVAFFPPVTGGRQAGAGCDRMESSPLTQLRVRRGSNAAPTLRNPLPPQVAGGEGRVRGAVPPDRNTR